MSFQRLLSYSVCCQVLLCLALPASAFADGSFRTVLVIDASSSMRNTDPQKLRKVAAELYVDLARVGDHVAVTGFDGSARDSSGAFVTIGTVDTRDALKAKIAAVGDDGDWTDFTAGLTEAKRLLDSVPRQTGDQDLILFLTDGKCDPDPKASPGTKKPEREAACQKQVLDTIVPALGTARVYPIGLSAAAPKGFLEELGRRTGGQGRVTQRAAALPRMFAGVYAQLLGSRLQKGNAKKQAKFTVFEGAETLDLILVGKAKQSSRLVDPNGTEIPIHNRQPESYYFVGHDRYRLFKVSNPVPGRWTLKVVDGGARSFSTLQHFNLVLSMVNMPEVAEMGRSSKIGARLATPSGTIPAASFLDHHEMNFVAEGKKRRQEKIRMTRDTHGVWWASYTPSEMGEVKVGLVLEPGPDGVLSRRTPMNASLQVVPPLTLVVAPPLYHELKQGQTADGKISFKLSDLGVDIKVALEIESEDAVIRPKKLSVPANGNREFDVEITVDSNAATGRQLWPLKVTPLKPKGFSSRAKTVNVQATVVTMSFWERYGTWFMLGGGLLIGLVLIGGMTTPAKFSKRALLYYKDVRDPELPRQSSYALGARAKRGFFKAARIRVGPTGPVKTGGVVELMAGGGSAITATPSSASAKVYKVPNDDEDDFSSSTESDEGRQEVFLTNGSFRCTPNVRYEIEGSGLIFWVK